MHTCLLRATVATFRSFKYGSHFWIFSPHPESFSHTVTTAARLPLGFLSQLIPAFSGGIVEIENYVRQGARVEQLTCGKAIRYAIVTQCPQIGMVDSGHRATRVQMGQCCLGHIR
jgi:hypothetical protein